MFNNPFSNTNKPISEKEIAALEQELGIILPYQYKIFLLKYNGGIPQRTAYLNPIDNEIYDFVSEFLPFTQDKDTNEEGITSVVQMYLHIRPYISDMLPIADDPGGNLFCLSIRQGANYGYVYFLPEDLDQDEIDYHNTINRRILAVSLRDFINGLVEYNDENLPYDSL